MLASTRLCINSTLSKRKAHLAAAAKSIIPHPITAAHSITTRTRLRTTAAQPTASLITGTQPKTSSTLTAAVHANAAAAALTIAAIWYHKIWYAPQCAVAGARTLELYCYSAVL